MALNYDLSNVENVDETCYIVATEDAPFSGISKGDYVLRTVTNGLIWATMSVGIGRITKDNCREFAARVNLWEQLNGVFAYEWDAEQGKHVDRHLTEVDVRAHIGLSTNVIDQPRDEWLAGVFRAATNYRAKDPIGA